MCTPMLTCGAPASSGCDILMEATSNSGCVFEAWPNTAADATTARVTTRIVFIPPYTSLVRKKIRRSCANELLCELILAMHVSQSHVTTLIQVCEPRVIEANQPQNRRIHVVIVKWRFH